MKYQISLLHFFKTEAPAWQLNLTAISIILLVWQNSVQNMLFATKKFLRANIYINLANVIKTAVILYLAFVHLISVGSIIFVFGIVGPFIFFILLFLEKRELVILLARATVHRDDFRFGYTFKYFIGYQFFNLGSRMDLFLLKSFNYRDEAGFYGLSQKIMLAVISSIVSITQVLSPGFSDIKRKSEVFPHIKRSVMYLLIPCALFVIIFFLPVQVYNIVFTPQYGPATQTISSALSIPYIIYTLSNVVSLFVLYTVKKPIHIIVANVTFFLVTSIGSYLLIPILGVLGPPLALGIGFAIATIYLISISFLGVRKTRSRDRLIVL